MIMEKMKRSVSERNILTLTLTSESSGSRGGLIRINSLLTFFPSHSGLNSSLVKLKCFFSCSSRHDRSHAEVRQCCQIFKNICPKVSMYFQMYAVCCRTYICIDIMICMVHGLSLDVDIS
jgi:hypothetical protein